MFLFSWQYSSLTSWQMGFKGRISIDVEVGAIAQSTFWDCLLW